MAGLKSVKNLYIATFVFGAFGVVLGAFGAHLLAERLPAQQLSSFKTGVLYHFIHVIAALTVLNIVKDEPSKMLKISALLFLSGIILFSGSLYLLSTRDILGLTNYKWLGPITPIGGILFIAGWINAAIFFFKAPPSTPFKM